MLQYGRLKIAGRPLTNSFPLTPLVRNDRVFRVGIHPTSHLTARHSHPNAVQCRPLPESSGTSNPGIGRLWNRFKECRRGNRCPYRHSCLHCNGPHPRASCPRRSAYLSCTITREPPCSSTPLFAVTITICFTRTLFRLYLILYLTLCWLIMSLLPLPRITLFHAQSWPPHI